MSGYHAPLTMNRPSNNIDNNEQFWCWLPKLCAKLAEAALSMLEGTHAGKTIPVTVVLANLSCTYSIKFDDLIDTRSDWFSRYSNERSIQCCNSSVKNTDHVSFWCLQTCWYIRAILIWTSSWFIIQWKTEIMYHYHTNFADVFKHVDINPAKKETPHSFKGQQLENKSLYRFVIYMGFLEKYLSYNLTLSL